MRKEIIIAIFVGIFVGLAVAFGVWRANTAMNTADQSPFPAIPGSTDQNNETQQTNDPKGIVLSQPEDLDVTTSKTIDIKGITKPDSLVVISAEENDYMIKSDRNGEFTQTVTLVGGINRLQLEAYDPNMQKSATEINIVYSEEFEST